MAAMRRGDFAAAWAISDAVLAARDPAQRDDPALPYHRRWVWDGRPFAGRAVLVRSYHGLGDTIQFVRFLPMLRTLASSVWLETQPELLALLAELPGMDRLIPFRPDAPHPPAECDIEIMELAHALRIALPALPGQPYLACDAGRLAAVRARIGQPAFAIGICWRAGGWDPRRSVERWQLVAAVAQPGVRLICVQGRAAGVDTRSSAAGAITIARAANEICETAALLGAVDLVVTVDTMVAHLAGALGRPTWLLLHADADWRWMADRPDSPWYPSMRLYRQRRPGEWREPLAEIAADLARCLVAVSLAPEPDPAILRAQC